MFKSFDLDRDQTKKFDIDRDQTKDIFPDVYLPTIDDLVYNVVQ